jgi:hypothetical protein
MSIPQLTLYSPGSQALVLSLNMNDVEELLGLLVNVSESSKFHCIKVELEKQESGQWFKDQSNKTRPYFREEGDF